MCRGNEVRGEVSGYKPPRRVRSKDGASERGT